MAWVFGVLGAIIVLAVIALVVYSQVGVMAAEPEPLAAMRADPAIHIVDDSAAIVLTPASGANGDGLVFYPGAKVDPWAYAAKLSGLVAEGATVVIVKPWLNLALFDLRPVSTFTALAPEVDQWAVGGHSLGGVKACQVAGDVGRLILFASYCATDISGTPIPVLSIAGSEDGLSTPQKIADNRHLLPADADLVEIAGASHSSFGDYGLQPGDGTPTISDEDMTAQISHAAVPFLGG
ncbi:alpha/beta hydrolase [Microbacterium deminutum]|uniref:alpha/beta hydrolase n=1 Tax=Microbacterium deminutum TaxID=344164 RepID=UPI0031CE6DA7